MENNQLIKPDSIQVMIDTETMGLRTTTAPILSLAAVKFTLNDGIIDKFKVNMSMKDQVLNYGRIPEKDTIDWWNKQGSEAIKHSLSNTKPALEGMSDFVDWYGNKSLWTWANGLDFDIPKLNELWISVHGGANKKLPWAFWHQCDYRTVLTIFGYQNNIVRKLQTELTYHDALSDAIGQTEFLIKILKALNE